MTKRLTLFFALVAITFTTNANDEVFLGEYHFNDATNIYQIGGSNAVQMGAIFRVNDGWTFSVNEGGNGLYRATTWKDRNFGFPPIGAFVEPKSGFIVRITKVEISHRTVATGTGVTQKFAYFLGMTNTVNSSTDITAVEQVPASGTEFTTRTFTFDTPIDITGNRFWFNNRINTNQKFAESGVLVTSEVDYIKFYGTFVDPFQPSIIVSTEIKKAKAALIGGTSSETFTIDHRNLTDVITASSSKSNFNAYFTDANEGIYKSLKVDFTPTTVGYDTTQITLTSGAVSAVLKVRAWGLPYNTFAAWNFDNQNLIPEYLANTQDSAKIEPMGPSTGKFTLLEGSYTYEVNNLYTTSGSTEVPEIAGIKISNLGQNGEVRLIFDLAGRNGSPNTLKAGSYASGQQTLTGVYWKNPKVTLRFTNVNLALQAYNGELAVVSAFDQTLEPPRFVWLNPDQTAFNNASGWAFDNVIVTTTHPQSIDETQVNKLQNRSYVDQGQLFIQNNQEEIRVNIYSLDGKMVKAGLISGNEGMQVGDLKGIYVVRLSGTTQISNEKVVF